MSQKTEARPSVSPRQATRQQSLDKIKIQTEELIAQSRLQAEQSSRVSRYSAEVLADVHAKRNK